MHKYLTKLISRSFMVFSILVFPLVSWSQTYQELTPVSVYSGANGDVYIVMASDIGANGCTHNKNNVLISASEQSSDLAKAALSITLAAIASDKKIKVHWLGCLSGGRPKADLVGFGVTEIN